MTRNRTAEPAERTRAQRREAQLCELCGRWAGNTVRCKACSRRVESNTDRYRGQGRRGAPERSKTDLVDLGYAREAIERAVFGWTQVVGTGETNRRRRAEALIEPRSQALFARRALDEVLARNPELADNAAAPLPPVDEAVPRGYHERKAEGLCVRCGRPAKDDVDLCERHHRDALKRYRKAAAKRRAKRRAAKRCVDCNRRTSRYRCEKCSNGGVHKKVHNGASATTMSTTAERMRKMGM